MHREGHVGIGLILYAPIAYLLVRYGSLTLFGLGLIAIQFWSFAPDVDMTLPIQHRGPTHTILAAVGAGFTTAGVTVYLLIDGMLPNLTVPFTGILMVLTVAGFAFLIGFVGVIGHLLGDFLTPMGIQPWWPFSARKHGLGVVYAADENANNYLSKAGAVAVLFAILAGEGVALPGISSTIIF